MHVFAFCVLVFVVECVCRSASVITSVLFGMYEERAIACICEYIRIYLNKISFISLEVRTVSVENVR